MNSTAPELDERSRKILDLEALWFQYSGIKEQRVRETFGLTMVRYYQLVNTIIDTEAAMAYNPNLVKRLQARRAANKRSRGVNPYGA